MPLIFSLKHTRVNVSKLAQMPTRIIVINLDKELMSEERQVLTMFSIFTALSDCSYSPANNHNYTAFSTK